MPTSKAYSGRLKRSYDDSFASDRRGEPPGNEKIDSLRRHRSSPVRESESAPLHATHSDSHATVSDPFLTSDKAKQVNVSPEHTRARPFRLNLQKKSDSRVSKTTLTEESPGVGSSAKKSLSFDKVIPVSETSRDKDPSHSLRWALENKSNKKSWYEQTLEEEEEAEAELASRSPFLFFD